ncbi:hypothetical protein DER46DRAFT_579080 [Fusarium sp. MPI-SDFR-AT-0072]|nr:hypothetical protein DER46DRAFT_579080 [Fusarium sp. MPI-SDFR-AT-0072]
MGDADTVTTYPGDYRYQSATAKESRDEADVAEMLNLTTQLANLSTTSANLTERISELPNAHNRICRKRTCHNPHYILVHYLQGLQSLPTSLCPRHALGAAAIRRYYRSVSENRRHVSTSAGVMLGSITGPGCSRTCSRTRKRLRDCLYDDLPTIAEDANSPQAEVSSKPTDVLESSAIMQE